MVFGSIPSTRYLDFLVELDQCVKIDAASKQARCEPAGDVSQYSVTIRCKWSDSPAPSQTRGFASFDWVKLKETWDPSKPGEYGCLLSDSLFQNPAVREAYIAADAMTESGSGEDSEKGAEITTLRLRLAISPDACELHNLYWETLVDPRSGGNRLQLSTSEKVLFSRFLSSRDMRPVRTRARARLKALAVVASPSDLLARCGLEPAPEGELESMVAALGKIPAARLPEQGLTASLANLDCAMRQKPVDILYLACHGRVIKGEPQLYMEDDQGLVKPENGEDLVALLRDLPNRPRLVVLASCRSAGGPGADMLAALGPRLLEAGIPAVIAMHGDISMKTISALMPVFFEQLQRHGQIDLALAMARRKVKSSPDACLPVLLMRLENGLIWYEPNFYGPGGERSEFAEWPTLIKSIKMGKCTPILGPGFSEWLMGSEREIARSWASEFNFPLDRSKDDSLPEVAQFLRVDSGEEFFYDNLEYFIKERIRQVHGPDLPKDLDLEASTLDSLVAAVGKARRDRDPLEPNRLIASMPFKILLTANPSGLLTDALGETPRADQATEKKSPQVLLCPWNKVIKENQGLWRPKEERFIPDVMRPLVYHFFGRLEPLRSLVLTEDDYFNFLISFIRESESVPSVVQGALTNASLLFIGFKIEDWSFRVLMHYILSLEGAEVNLKGRPHVVVQLMPDADNIINPGAAYKYLQKSLSQGDAKLSLYWGSTEDFVRELHKRWQDSLPT